MEVVLNPFNKFLIKNGVLDQSGVNDLKKLCCKHNSVYEGDYEAIIFTHLASYLKINFKELKANNDEKIVKTIRKIFIIYQSKSRKLKVNKFLKWKLLSHKLKFVIKGIEKENMKDKGVVYKKKKSQDMPLSISDDSFKNRIKLGNSSKQSHDNSLNNREISYAREDVLQDIDENITVKEKFMNLANYDHIENYKDSELELNNIDNLIIKKKQDIHEKLYHDRHRKTIIYSEMEKNHRYNEIKQCTFTPLINKTKSYHTKSNSKDNKYSKDNEPHYVHLFSKGKEKEDRIRYLSVEKEKRMKSVYTFEPTINTNYKLRNISSDFNERLKYFHNSKNKKIKKISDDVNNSIPIPIPRSRLRDNSSLNVSVDKSEKIKEYQNKKKENIKRIGEHMLIEQGVTFKPKLNESVNMNISSSLLERNDDFARNKSKKLNNIVTRDDTECTFTPKVNNRTIQYDENYDVGDRLFHYQQKYQKNLEERKENCKESFPFKPEINNNTYDILKNKQLIMNEMKSKYETQAREEKEINNANYQLPKDRIYTQINEIEENFNENESNSVIQDEQTIRGNQINPISQIKGVSISTNTKATLSHRYEMDESLLNFKNTPKADTFRKSKEAARGAKYKMNPYALQNVSDSRLLEMANQYITTDESLDKFQSRLKEKYNKMNERDNEDNAKAEETLLNRNNRENKKIKNNKTFNQVVSNNADINNPIVGGEAGSSAPLINKKLLNNKGNKFANNIMKALKYYSMIES